MAKNETVREDILEIAGLIEKDIPHYDLSPVWLRAMDALDKLDESAPQCLDNPPNCSHRLVPDPTN